MRLIDADRIFKLLKEHKEKETGAFTKGIDWATDEDKWNEFLHDVFEDFTPENGIGSKGQDVLSEYVDDVWEFVSGNAIGRRETEILDLYMLAFKLAQEQLKEGV